MDGFLKKRLGAYFYERKHQLWASITSCFLRVGSKEEGSKWTWTLEMPGIQHRASCMLRTHSTTELHPHGQLTRSLFSEDDLMAVCPCLAFWEPETAGAKILDAQLHSFWNSFTAFSFTATRGQRQLQARQKGTAPTVYSPWSTYPQRPGGTKLE